MAAATKDCSLAAPAGALGEAPRAEEPADGDAEAADDDVEDEAAAERVGLDAAGAELGGALGRAEADEAEDTGATDAEGDAAAADADEAAGAVAPPQPARSSPPAARLASLETMDFICCCALLGSPTPLSLLEPDDTRPPVARVPVGLVYVMGQGLQTLKPPCRWL
ncbi:MAG: hypothetical protein JOZ39_11130 [Chloroflexi bacterium]|nr:hypothetical protein [Chloroflexota bacterium]